MELGTGQDLKRNLARVQDRIHLAAARAGRDSEEITLVAITKTWPLQVVREAYELGLCHFGENRVEEAAGKISEMQAHLHSDRPIKWHMVGHLQHRKVRDAVLHFDLIHSVDSVELAGRINARALEAGKRQPVLLEIKLSGEENKYGFPLDPRQTLFAGIDKLLEMPNLDVQGLMGMAPIASEPEQARPFFRTLRELSAELQSRYPKRPWGVLSMGMTNDFEIAIEEGATMVRIGRAIFGERE